MIANLARAVLILIVIGAAVLVTRHEGIEHASGFWLVAFVWTILAPWSGD